MLSFKDEVVMDKLPHAIQIRVTSLPAGTALVTTTAAALASIGKVVKMEDLVKYSGYDVDLVMGIADKIRKDPAKYHIYPQAYDLPKLGKNDQEEVDRAKSAAERMAAFTQGFINALPTLSSMARARAISKHAEDNPAMTSKVMRYFRSLSKAKADSIEALFAVAGKTIEKARLADEKEG